VCGAQNHDRVMVADFALPRLWHRDFSLNPPPRTRPGSS
jgi:hypothetical protein